MTIEICDNLKIKIFNLVTCTVDELIKMHPDLSYVYWCDGYLLVVQLIEDMRHSAEIVEHNTYYIEQLFCAKQETPDIKLVNASNLQVYIIPVSKNNKLYTKIIHELNKIENNECYRET